MNDKRANTDELKVSFSLRVTSTFIVKVLAALGGISGIIHYFNQV